MIDQLITKVFTDRNLSHVEHWTTRSFAAHQALGAFYEDVVTALDAVVEAYIGCFGPLLKDGLGAAAGGEFSVEGLRDTADWIEINRKDISKDMDAVANLVDGVTAVYLAAIYKLERFK